MFRRDLTTFACYFLLSLLTLFLAMIGPLAPALMSDLGFNFSQISLHSVSQACGMLVTGAIGERVALRYGRRACMYLSLVLMCAGMVLLCLAVHPGMSLSGAFVIGCGGSLTLMVGNSAMAERHGAQASIAFGEANIVAYLGIIAAPAVVSVMTIFAHWRYTVVVPLLAVTVFLMVFRSADYGRPVTSMHATGKAPLGFAYWCFWGLLMTAVSAESILLVWAAAYFEKQLGWAREAALTASMVFPLGILASRFVGVVLVRRYPVRTLVLAAIAVAVAGVLLFLQAGSVQATLVGLAVAGLGMGNLYPFGITLAMAAAGGDRDTATARVSMASAASMITAPLIIGGIADRYDLSTAFSVVPIYLALSAALAVAGLGRVSRPPLPAAGP